MWAKKLWVKDLVAGSTFYIYSYYSQKINEMHVEREKGLIKRK